jgi:hypothetical protein
MASQMSSQVQEAPGRASRGGLQLIKIPASGTDNCSLERSLIDMLSSVRTKQNDHAK